MARVNNSVQVDEDTTTLNDVEIFARDIELGLSANQKNIPAAYHYDAEGSRIFKKITKLPEYYLSRCEIDALESNREEIGNLLEGNPVNLIEFGPGGGSKTRTLIEYFLSRKLNFRYVAVDISPVALDHLDEDYQSRFPQLPVDCVVANYVTDLHWLKENYREKNLVLFLGSSIGNFFPGQAEAFLRNLQQDLNGGDLAIIGFDLIKEPELIHAAYNDAQEVTAAFNVNMLKRINRELDGEFDVTKFRYEGRYSATDRVVRSYLISLEDQKVRIGALDRTFHFRRGELIHTEDSHKYREKDIEDLAERTGFTVRAHLYDSEKHFVDSVWEVRNE